MSKIVCSVCGSDDVQAKVWVKLNENYETTTEFIDEMIREPADCWCCNCEENQKLIIIEEEKKQPNNTSKNNIHMFIDEKTQNTIHATLDKSVSHGTMRYQELIPAFMNVIRDTPEYVQLMDQLPAYAQEDKTSNWWESEDASWLFTELLETLEQYAPEGYTCGTHPGDGAEYGYWKVDSSEEDNGDTLESILEDTDKCERFAEVVLDEINSDEEQPHHIGSNIIKAYQNGDCDALLIALCGWSMDSLLGKFNDNKPNEPKICPDCQEEALKYAMIDVDDTNLEEGYSCSECGANFIGLDNEQVIKANT